MICYYGTVSLYSWLSTVVTYSLLFFPDTISKYFSQITYGLILGQIIYFIAINAIVRLIYHGNAYQIAVRAVFLAFIFSLGLFLRLYGSLNLQIFGTYMCIMSMFHYTEFLCISIIQPKLVSVNSFIINHSSEYTIAALTSWLEFALESYFFPSLKTALWISNMGLAICIAGEALRKGAMLTAKSNFNHLVQSEKQRDHILVTHGVYSLFRHPSYVGWFYWSIGTQIILLNPFCIIAYTCASWCFFKDRINIEEITLLNFFGQQYCDYQQKVGTGLPFIQGYKINP